MPIHQNEDGTWQWGKSGKKYKKKEDAIKQMKAIFANGYVEKHASYTDTLNNYRKFGDPSAFISTVARQDPKNFSAVVPSVENMLDPSYRERSFLWKAQGMDFPWVRNKMLRDGYFKALYQRESSNNPHMLIRDKNGQIVSAGIGSVDKPGLKQMKQMKLVPQNFKMVDFIKDKNQGLVDKAIKGLQTRFFNKEQIGNSPNKLRGLSFFNPADVRQMYIRYNNGRKTTRKIQNIDKKIARGQRISPYEQSLQYFAHRKDNLYEKDFKNKNPHLYPLVYP